MSTKEQTFVKIINSFGVPKNKTIDIIITESLKSLRILFFELK